MYRAKRETILSSVILIILMSVRAIFIADGGFRFLLLAF